MSEKKYRAKVVLPPLSKEDIAELKVTFNVMDTDQSGRLDQEEMRKFAEARGLNPSFIKLLFVMFDKDKSGTICFKEFKHFIKAMRLLDTTPEAFYRMVFDAIDTDKNGTFSARELSIFFQALGHNISVEEAGEMIAKIDSKGTKTVTFHEILIWLKLQAKKKKQ